MCFSLKISEFSSAKNLLEDSYRKKIQMKQIHVEDFHSLHNMCTDFQGKPFIVMYSYEFFCLKHNA